MSGDVHIRPSPLASLAVLRPYLVLGTFCGLFAMVVDWQGLFFGFGVALAVGLIDAVGTAIIFGRRIVVVDATRIRCMWGRFTVAQAPVSKVTGVLVDSTSQGWLSLISAAYPVRCEVTLLGTKARFEFQAATDRQVQRFEEQLGSALEDIPVHGPKRHRAA